MLPFRIDLHWLVSVALVTVYSSLSASVYSWRLSPILSLQGLGVDIRGHSKGRLLLLVGLERCLHTLVVRGVGDVVLRHLGVDVLSAAGVIRLW